MADGGIAQARLLYERAAEAGLAQGAMAMAATYDPAELQRLGVRGLKPDQDQARRWYERARQLGAADAEQRLRRLGEARRTRPALPRRSARSYGFGDKVTLPEEFPITAALSPLDPGDMRRVGHCCVSGQRWNGRGRPGDRSRVAACRKPNTP